MIRSRHVYCSFHSGSDLVSWIKRRKSWSWSRANGGLTRHWMAWKRALICRSLWPTSLRCKSRPSGSHKRQRKSYTTEYKKRHWNCNGKTESCSRQGLTGSKLSSVARFLNAKRSPSMDILCRGWISWEIGWPSSWRWYRWGRKISSPLPIRFASRRRRRVKFTSKTCMRKTGRKQLIFRKWKWRDTCVWHAQSSPKWSSSSNRKIAPALLTSGARQQTCFSCSSNQFLRRLTSTTSSKIISSSLLHVEEKWRGLIKRVQASQKSSRHVRHAQIAHRWRASNRNPWSNDLETLSCWTLILRLLELAAF